MTVWLMSALSLPLGYPRSDILQSKLTLSLKNLAFVCILLRVQLCGSELLVSPHHVIFLALPPDGELQQLSRPLALSALVPVACAFLPLDAAIPKSELAARFSLSQSRHDGVAIKGAPLQVFPLRVDVARVYALILKRDAADPAAQR